MEGNGTPVKRRLSPRLIVMVMLVGALLSIGPAVGVKTGPGVVILCTGRPECNGGPPPEVNNCWGYLTLFG